MARLGQRVLGLPAWLWAALAALFGLVALALLWPRRDGDDEKKPTPPTPPEEPVTTPLPRSQSHGGAAPRRGVAQALPDLPETHLVIDSGARSGERLRLHRSRIRIGAVQGVGNDHVISSGTISSRHAEVQIFPSGDMWVRDLGSTNGSYVNDRKVPADGKLPLRPGDRLRLGPDTVLTVERPGQGVTPASQSRAREARVLAGNPGPDALPSGDE